MNLTLIRSGNIIVLKVECIKGYAFKAAIARKDSALFQDNLNSKAVLSSSFTPEIVFVNH